MSVSDKELADRIVALGIGKRTSFCMEINGSVLSESKFVRDWRVAGALMEKVKDREWLTNVAHDGVVFVFTDRDEPYDCIEIAGESLPRTIIEACVEALDE